MNKNINYQVTEWDWFKLQLKLYAVESRGTKWYIHFIFNPKETPGYKDRNVEIICEIFNLAMDEILDVTKDKETLLKEFFNGWVEMEKRALSDILKDIPILGKEFDLEQHISFEIMRCYGMGSTLICTFIGSDVVWSKYFNYFPEE